MQQLRTKKREESVGGEHLKRARGGRHVVWGGSLANWRKRPRAVIPLVGVAPHASAQQKTESVKSAKVKV